MPVLGSPLNDNGHRWEYSNSELPRCTRCHAFEYQSRAFPCPVSPHSIPEDFPLRSRRRRALEKRLERRRVRLDDLRTFPDYFTCSACKRPTREAPAGLALGIRTRWRWVDDQRGPITLSDGRIISITETADVCSGPCFSVIMTDARWLPVTDERRVELAERDEPLLDALGELVFVYGGEQTLANVERVLAARRAP